jgi:hypothetical protein
MGWDGRDEKMCTKFWLENMKGRGNLEDLGVDGKVMLEWILEREFGKVRTGFVWLSIWTSG